MAEGEGQDALLIAADLDPTVGKFFREPSPREREAAARAEGLLAALSGIAPDLPAVPDERIPEGNSDTVRPSVYGRAPTGTSATRDKRSDLFDLLA